MYSIHYGDDHMGACTSIHSIHNCIIAPIIIQRQELIVHKPALSVIFAYRRQIVAQIRSSEKATQHTGHLNGGKLKVIPE